MEYKVDALLISEVNYGENDRMVVLLTPNGRLSAAMKGVRDVRAKLRFAAQPFAFCEYVIAERNRRRTVIGATLHEAFYDVSTSMAQFYAASTIAEVCNKIVLEEMPSSELLVAAVEGLEAVQAAEGSPLPPLVEFFLRAMDFAGYPVSAENCPHCGKKMVGRRYFDMENGAFGCSDCAVGIPASEVTYDTIRYYLAKHGMTKDGAPKPEEEPPYDGVVRAVRLLRNYIDYKIDADLRCVDELLNVFSR